MKKGFYVTILLCFGFLLMGGSNIFAGTVSLYVNDHNGALLSGVNVYYNDYSNHYVLLGNTTSNNPVVTTLSGGPYNFKAVKNHTEQIINHEVSGTVTFQTSEFLVHVENSDNQDFEGIAVAFNDYSNHYLSMGNTDSDGEASIELFSGTRKFRATKDHTTATGETTDAIEFQTSEFSVHVKKSNNDDFEGIAVAFNDYSNHYLSMGATDSDGLATIELFDGTRKFRATKDHTTATGETTDAIEFQTSEFSVHVKKSNNDDFEGIAVAFNDYSNHYLSMGNTNEFGYAYIELFDGTRKFRATKNHTYATGQTTSTIEFQTSSAVGFVKDCDSDDPIPGIQVAFNDYSNHWLNFGPSDVDGKAYIELFAGDYDLRAATNHTSQVMPISLSGTSTMVEFNPTRLCFSYSGTVKYNDYSNHWMTITCGTYLFPGTYLFKFGDVQTNLTVSGCYLSGGIAKLVDEAGNPLANYPSDYPGETRNLQYKYRCGGSWAASTSFQTDANGFFVYTIGCGSWDNKITVTLNQTTKEQDVTVNSTFQAAKVNANLKSCTGPITNSPGGSVDQGGGYWYHHGNTGPSGTVSLYTFPISSIKPRMSYSHNSQTLYPTITAGTNEVDYQTTKVTFNFPGDIKSNKGGSWWMFSKPSMDLLPGSYPFYFKTGSSWTGPITVNVSGCEIGGWPTLIHFEESDGTPIEGDKAWYKDYYIPGGEQYAGMSDANGNIFLLIPDGNHHGKIDYFKGEDKTYDEYKNNYDISVNPVVTFKTIKVTVKLQDHDQDGTTDDLSGNEAYDLYVDAYAGSRQHFGSGTTTGYQETMELLPSTYKYNFEMRYEGVKEFINNVQITTANNTVTFSTGKVHDGTGTVVKYDSYSQSPHNIPFTNDVDFLTNHYELKFIDASNHIVFQGFVHAGATLNDDGTYSSQQFANDEFTIVAPEEFKLYLNYPNPFNPTTTLKFTVKEANPTTLKVYNTLGQEIATLFNGTAEPGKFYQFQFDASNLGSGMYIYQLKSGDNVSVKQMMLTK